MRAVASSGGRAGTVAVRRSESADARGIAALVGPAALEVFGRVNVIQLLEKANLAVTLTNEKDAVLAHAAFFDHPAVDVVDPALWETFLQRHFHAERCTPLNTLFLRLFVAEPSSTAASAKEIFKAVFAAAAELEFICLLSRSLAGRLEAALDQLFEPLQRRDAAGPPGLALVCHRYDLCPRVLVRPARIEDHDDIMRVLAEQTERPSILDRPAGLAELIDAQNHDNHAAVCESDGAVVAFASVTADVDEKQLQEDFLLRRDDTTEEEEAAAASQQAEPPPTWSPRKRSTFRIQLLAADMSHDVRSADLLPYVFARFPELDRCIFEVSASSPDVPLLQSFVRTPPRPGSSPPFELYVFNREGLRNVVVRAALAADRPAVSDLVKGVRLKEALLRDLDRFLETRRDAAGVPLQAFVAQVDGRVVGVLIIADEQDVEYLRAHYNIESFIYFSHHGYEEHAAIRHLVLKPSFQHLSRHVFKEALRLAHRSCLYHRAYPPPRSPDQHQHQDQHQQEEEEGEGNSCVPRLDVVLDCAVPVRPRRQVVYPLEELGVNAPSRRITEEQPAFALSLISRKLTMEPKLAVSARVVVVGASDAGVAFLEVLCFCPHLRFNNLTLISTHGFPGNHEAIGFLSTSHAYGSRDVAQLPWSCISVIAAKMVGIDRKSKQVLLSSGGRVAYDHLILSTGLQYQVPRPTGVDLNQLQAPPTHHRYTGPVPSNLFTLNDQHDCAAARRWLCANFVEREDAAIVYGDGVDVYTTVETLLGLGVSGSRIRLVLLPGRPPGASCLGDPAVEEAVTTGLEKAGVRVHRDCVLAQMNDGEHPDPLTSASFAANGECLRLPCGVFINLSNKGVDHDALRSINKSFLVFDRRLVINAAFRTCDPAIYAAGPLTKFSRRYHADEWSHASWNPKEVGQELAAALLPLFDPTLEPVDEPAPGMDRLLPLYKQPKIQGGKLPGGLNYLHVSRPSSTDAAPASPAEHCGRIVTGRVETGNYFSLHLDGCELVEALTCVSLKPLPLSNYLSLYGKHQQLLGQLASRHRQGQVQDLYSFLARSSCLAVFHDRFPDFQQELQQVTWTHLKGDGSTASGSEQEEAESRAALRRSAAKYLSYNRNLLPMFACPGQL